LHHLHLGIEHALESGLHQGAEQALEFVDRADLASQFASQLLNLRAQVRFRIHALIVRGAGWGIAAFRP
jgi:hypothetical protein